MIPPNRPSTATKLALFAAFLGLLLLFPASSLAEEGTATTPIHYQKESLQEFEKQLAASEVQSATINKKIRSIRLTLKDGRHVLFKYGAHEEPKYLSQLQAKGIAVTVLTPAQAAKEPKKPVKHKLRYIVGGIVIVIVIVVGAVLFLDRKRKRAAME